MTNPIADISQRKAARVAGFGFLIKIIALIYFFFVLNSMTLDVPGDEAVTAVNNIKTIAWLFYVLIASILIIIMIDVVIALALYALFKPINRDLAILVAVIRLTYVVFFTVCVIFLFIEPLSFSYVFAIGQLIYVLHMIVLGYLIFKSGYIPRILGVLLIIGGTLGYLIESLAYFFFPNYVWIASPGSMVGGIAEISLCFWLLLKGDIIPEIKPETDSLQH